MDDFTPEGQEELDLSVAYGQEIGDIPDQHAVPEGEYELRLLSVSRETQKEEKGSGRYIKAVFEVTSDPDSKLITHVMMEPKPTDKERQIKNNLRKIADFYRTFEIPLSGPVRLQNYEGNVGWAVLTSETSNEYGDQNRVKRFVPKK